ncbi:penicillin-binding transpeptidase domain-containing protein [Tolumonas lignilytica]|jgi:Cell division protein FtsI/penicillin-binding protein 2|uniref:penicillin-binding transpeptidase domain-containing protein n=1 Tax=Tolumonas lignilytica TaxID=1283284 RepID=UPI0004655279|nr:penicillin-binding transpeptidase domain-containing protein [Tolumonas lignilytica]
MKANTKRNNKKYDTGVAPWRFVLLLGFILIGFCGLVARTAWIQVIQPDRLRQEGDMRSLRTTADPSNRGMVTDRNGEELAVSVPVEAVWADPKEIHDADGLKNTAAWMALADVLGLDMRKLTASVADPKRRFVYLQRQITPSVADYISKLKLPGLHLRQETRRYYPSGEISAHLVGNTNIDGAGIEGIERSFNDWLSSTPSEYKIRKDRQGHVIENIGVVKEGKKANDLVLSIDERLQAIAYRSLKYATEVNKATSGSLVLLDVATGEVLAMVNTPSYNPNNREQYESFRARNRAVTDTYEPGSTVKPIVAMSALEHGVINWKEILDTRPFAVGGHIVTDSHHMASGGLYDILRYSSNIGMAHIAMRMQPQWITGKMEEFGLGQESGTGLMGESSGMIPMRSRWSNIELATLGFGYGLRVTPLQLAGAYAALANKGIRKPVSILKVAHAPQGQRIVSPEIAEQVIHALEGVVEEGGTGGKAAVPGYRVAGKTGTAKVATAGGYGKDYVGTFAGFAPVSNPRFAMVVIINEPHGASYYGGSVAGPTFAEVMSSALQLYNVPPDALPDLKDESNTAQRSEGKKNATRS